MKHSETITKLAAALVKAQAAMPSVTKDRTNPAFKFRYATLDAILETVKPILAAQELAIFQSGGDAAPGSVCIETMILHSSGEWIMSPLTLPVGKNDAQGVGSAITYARRYGLAAALSLATDEDDDANAASRPPKAPPSRPVAPPSPQSAVSPLLPVAPIDHLVKGKRLGDHGSEELYLMQKALRTDGKDKHAVLLHDITFVLNERTLGPSKKNAPPLSDEQRGELVRKDAPDNLGFPD